MSIYLGFANKTVDEVHSYCTLFITCVLIVRGFLKMEVPHICFICDIFQI